MYFYGPPHMAEQKQDDQLEHTYSSSVRIRDVALKMNDRGKWRERVRDICASGTKWWWWWWYIHIYMCVCVCVYIYCHVVSHWDDRNKINTILPFEWTVASRQRMTVKEECRSQRGYQQMLVLGNLTQVAGHQGGRKEKPNDWLGSQNGSRDSFSSAEIDSKKVSCLAGFVGDRTKSQVLRVKKTKKYLRDTKSHFLQASVRNSLKSISP